MTNRELLQKAMPLISLSNVQWEQIIKHIEKQKGEIEEILNILLINQSRLEVRSNYRDFYDDKLDEQVLENSVVL